MFSWTFFNPRAYNKTTETSQLCEHAVILQSNIVCDLSNVKRTACIPRGTNFLRILIFIIFAICKNTFP